MTKPSEILATAVIPWTEDYRFDADTFCREIA